MTLARAVLALLVLAIAAVAIVSFIAVSEVARRQGQLEAERSLATTSYGDIEYVSWGVGPAALVIHGASGGFDQGRAFKELLDQLQIETVHILAMSGGVPPALAVGETLAARIRDSEFISLETGGHLLLGHHAELRERISEHFAEPQK